MPSNVCPARLSVKAPVIDLGLGILVVEALPHEPDMDMGPLYLRERRLNETAPPTGYRCRHCCGVYVPDKKESDGRAS